MRTEETGRERATGDGARSGDYGEAFPASRKVYVEGTRGVRVPFREIALSRCGSTTRAARAPATRGPGCRRCARRGCARGRSAR
jgi:hypothetical protein